MARPEKTTDPYFLDPGFEKAVVTLAAHRPKFWGRIANALDPKALGDELCTLALSAVAQMAKETGRGPDRLVLVLQRLRRWMDDGKVTLEQVEAISDLFDDAVQVGLPGEDAATAELVPLIRRRIQGEAVRTAMDEYANHTDFKKSTDLISRANRLGDVSTSVGIKLGSSGGYEAIEGVRRMQRMPLGIPELDLELKGGMPRGCLGMYMGGPGDGKSMALSHTGAVALQRGLFVLEATLELDVSTILARYKAHLTDTPIDAIEADPRIIEAQLAAMQLGTLIVEEFTPLVTTMEDIEDWVSACEEQEGRECDLLITDYGDKLGAPKTAGKEAEHGYSSGRIVFERMRIWAHERKRWHLTASQATRKKDKRKRLDVDDTADSMHKPRIADLVVTLNYKEDQSMMELYCAKNRHGKGKFPVGPLPTAFEVGKLVT
jgi:hypothetical protein